MAFPLSSEKACALSGLISPQHLGHRRRYNQAETLAVMIYLDARERKLPLIIVQEVIPRFLRNESDKRIKVISWIVVDARTGNCVFTFKDDVVIASVVAMGPCLVIDVAAMRERFE